MDEKGQRENVAEFIENDQAYNKRKYFMYTYVQAMVREALSEARTSLI